MKKSALFGALAALLLSGASHASPATDFLDAETALAKDDLETYNRLRQRLDDYPLLPYLEYAEIERRKDQPLDEKTVSSFLKRHAGSSPAHKLRGRWLKQLAGTADWKNYLKWYDENDSGTTAKCRYLVALIRTGKGKKTHAELDAVWNHGRSRPSACDPVFSYWKKAGLLTRDKVWERADKAMNLGQTRVATHLAGYLPAGDSSRLASFVKLRKSPKANLDAVAGKHPWRGQMLGYGLKRLAYKSPEDAVSTWNRLKTRIKPSAAERCTIEERLARGLYREPGKAVYGFFKATGACKQADELHAYRVKAALLREDWKQVETWIAKMPATLAKKPEWRYWKARALEQQGRQNAAREIYRQITDDRSFYAYLASDRLGKSYRFAHAAAPVRDAEKNRLQSDKAMLRIRELDRLGRQAEMRSEWNLLLKQLDKRGKMAAAAIFHEWGILDRAIFTLAKSGYWDDMEIRFPTKHRKLVASYAGTRKLDSSWAFGIMRQESAFMRDATSSAGARGLMQLMPATARQVAKKFSLGSTSGSEILDPDKNIALGTGYLRMMLDRFDNNMTLATASYNAGPHRAKKWQYDKRLPADIWVELIPFDETRGYVKRVMTYASIYDQRLGKGDKRRISDRIGTIPPRKG
jgi:soluble lytic murein transglycosylase